MCTRKLRSSGCTAAGRGKRAKALAQFFGYSFSWLSPASVRGTQGCPLPCCASGGVLVIALVVVAEQVQHGIAWSGSRTLLQASARTARLLTGARVAQIISTEHDTAGVRFGLQLLLRLAVEKLVHRETKETSVTASLFGIRRSFRGWRSASTTVTSISASKSTCSPSPPTHARRRCGSAHARVFSSATFGSQKPILNLMIHHFLLLGGGGRKGAFP